MRAHVFGILATMAMASLSFAHANAATTKASLVAQVSQSTGTIAGKVVDGAGKPLSGVRISITGPKSAEAVTKADGTYRVTLPPGIYIVTISAPGFQSTQQGSVLVFSGESERLATTLLPASLTTIAHVSVGGSTTSVSDSASSSTRLTLETIRSQGQDQVVNVLDQLPGVEILRVGGGSNEPGANSSISTRGAQPYESQVLIDGHPVDTIGNGAYGFNTTFINSILLGGVEISKGPGNMPNTVADAVGGTVNFQTAPITSKPTGELMTQSDSFGGWTYGLRYSDTLGKLGFLVGVARETTPGYMAPQYIFGFGRASFFSPNTSPTYPLTGNNQVYPPGTNYVGVLNFNYLATSDFSNHSSLFKLAYNFSPTTTLQLSNYSTQTWLDETGNNVGNVNVTVVPCITTGLVTGSVAPAPTCAAGTNKYDENYTAAPYLGYVGQTVPVNLYAGYPNTYETDNEPITTADLRTVIGPGTFLARYYAGSITRDVIQNNAYSAIGPCFSPACDWVGNIPGSAADPNAFDNGYSGEAYFEETTDLLHGADAQYSVPFGNANYLTLGFDKHSDSYNYQELYANGWYPPCVTQACAYALSEPPAKYLKVDSTTENARLGYMVTPKLQLELGAYLSNTTYVGSRFDPRGGLTWRPSSKLSLRASMGSAYVTPYEGMINPRSYVSKKTFHPTTQFNAETSSGYDLGVDYAYGRDSLVSADYYSTNIYNRYATINENVAGTYNGAPYTSEVIPTSQGQSLNQGFELSVVHQPKVGWGYHASVDLLRDYFYDQATVGLNNFGGVFLGPLPDNGVQLPGYPFSKMRGDLWYQFADGKNVRISATTYGGNNAFGRPGFAVFDGAFKLPVTASTDLTLGMTNIFNQDNGATGGLYFGGYTYAGLGGGVGPTNWEYATPQTLYVQLSKTIGR